MIIPRTDPRVRRRPLARVLAAFATAVLAATIGLVGIAPAQAQEEEPQTDGTVELTLVLGEHGAVAQGSALSGTVSIENGLAVELSAGHVSLALDRSPLPDGTAVTSWLNSGGAGTFTTVFSAPTAAVPSQATADTPVFVAAETLQGLPAGVYPVRATFADATSGDGATAWNLSVRSVLTVRAGAEPVISIMVPITATPEGGDLLTAEELTLLTAEDGALTAQLDAVTGTAAVLAVDPAIPAAIRVLGTAAPDTALAWLARLETLSNERFALQFGDADATVQSQAGLETLLGPTTLSPFMDAVNFPDPVLPTPTPTPTPDADAELVQLPDVQELTAIESELTGVLWPRGEVTAEDIQRFDAYVDGPVTTVLPSTSVTDAPGAVAEIGGSSVLVANAELSGLLSDAAAETGSGARSAILAEANAALFFAGRPASGVLVALDRDETRTADALDEVLDAVSAAPLATLQNAAVAPANLVNEPSGTRAAQLRTLLDDETRLGRFATILEDPQVLLAPERIRLLRILGVGMTDAQFESAFAAHREETTATLGAVSLQDSGPIQLFSANVSLPVWIRNDLPWPVQLELEVRPSDPRIVIEPYTQVEGLAANNTKVLIPVESRVASGDLQVRFSLTSPTGVPIGQQTSAAVTVRAEWENIGLGILGGVIVLLLVFGVVRTLRRRRHEARETEPALEAEPAPEGER